MRCGEISMRDWYFIRILATTGDKRLGTHSTGPAFPDSPLYSVSLIELESEARSKECEMAMAIGNWQWQYMGAGCGMRGVRVQDGGSGCGKQQATSGNCVRTRSVASEM